MKVLIDNVEGIINNRGQLMGKDINGRTCPVADHGYGVGMPHGGKKNFKGITCGHVYILNYDKDTFVPKPPMTFDEYRELKKENPDFKL